MDFKINYEDLLELMHLRHHTRKSVAQAIGISGAAYGRYFSKGIPMPGEIVIGTAQVLDIKSEDYGRYFYGAGAGTNSDQLHLEKDELVMLKIILMMRYTDLPEHLWTDARILYKKIDDYTRSSIRGGMSSAVLQMSDLRRQS